MHIKLIVRHVNPFFAKEIVLQINDNHHHHDHHHTNNNNLKRAYPAAQSAEQAQYSTHNVH